MIVMELVEGGSLLMSLRKNAASLEQRQMMSMCRDTAAGKSMMKRFQCLRNNILTLFQE